MQIPTVVYFLIWAGLFALMMRFGCGAHVMGHRHGQKKSAGEPDSPSGDNAGSPPEREKFEAAPTNYLKGREFGTNQEHHHVS